MNCIPNLSGAPFVIQHDNEYYKDLLFVEILKDKIITQDSFDKLHFITKNHKITAISDSKGKCSWIVVSDVRGRRIKLDDEKVFQIKVDFCSNIIDSGSIVVEYELR